MKDFIAEHKILVAAAAVIIILAAALAGRTALKDNSSPGETAYVETVENLTGQNASLGLINRFAGVVEPQGLWTVSKNADIEVKEIYVTEGDAVNEGDVLFEYDTTKYEEDLEQAGIDLERLKNEYQSAQETIAQLEKEKREASSSDQANYTIQIKEQNLTLKDKELDIQIKESEIEKLENNIENAEVKSGIDGIVKSISDGDDENSDSSAFITVMKTGTFRIKGTINEQNIGDLTADAAVLVHSRVNDKVWKGTITKIDVENAITSSDSNGFGSGGDSAKSSKYPFYVELENSDGLIMGQHVYVELDLGQADEDSSGGIWIASYMVDQTDPDHPFVWKDVNGRLQKQEVRIGEVREEIGKVCIVEGLTLTDSICIPDETLHEGMKTAPMSEKPDESEAGEGRTDYEFSEEEEFSGDETMEEEPGDGGAGSEETDITELEEAESKKAEELERMKEQLPEEQ